MNETKEAFEHKGVTYQRITVNGVFIGWQDADGNPLTGIVAKLVQGEYAYQQIEMQVSFLPGEAEI